MPWPAATATGWTPATADGGALRWQSRTGVTALFTDGSRNLATHAGDQSNVATDRGAVQTIVGSGPIETVRQVHGTGIAHDGTPWLAGGAATDPLVEADAIAKQRGQACAAVLVADCAPIVVAGSSRFVVVHAGWRGAAAGMVDEALAALGEDPIDAAIGPCIGRCCFEVGAEVAARFPKQHVQAGPDRALVVDLPGFLVAQLRAAGVQHVTAPPTCTACDAAYFSFRRQGPAAGRQALVAW